MVAGEPSESLVQPVPRGGAGGLHVPAHHSVAHSHQAHSAVPVPVPQSGQPQLLLDLVRLHGCGRAEYSRELTIPAPQGLIISQPMSVNHFSNWILIWGLPCQAGRSQHQPATSAQHNAFMGPDELHLHFGH